MLKFVLLFSLLIFSNSLLALETNVARVAVLWGHVRASYENSDLFEVKEKQALPEGITLHTSDKSFAKIIFKDNSQINLGPNSQMVITAFPKKEAGIISVLKGQIRAQVTKNYMEIGDKAKSKLYIKTKTAAFGIRGTDFQINFNPRNGNSSLITFEGRVSMAGFEKPDEALNYNQPQLEVLLSDERAVMVSKGQISAINFNVSKKLMIPTQLGVKQLNALFENTTGITLSNETNVKNFRSPIPPGVDSSMFASFINSNRDENEFNVPDNKKGFLNSDTGEYQFPAGSIIDLKTVNIIPPPKNSIFDPDTETFLIPENYGKVDTYSGEYIAPVGFKLNDEGKFILIELDEKDRKPSSERQTAPDIYDPNVIMTFNSKPQAVISDEQRSIAAEKLLSNEITRQSAVNSGTAPTSRNLKFILRAQ